jgi:putative endonuclease
MHFVYAIRSYLNGRIYIGQTRDVKDRLIFHNKGRVKSTQKDKPWELIAVQNMESRNKATWLERKLKNSHDTRLRWLREYGLE